MKALKAKVIPKIMREPKSEENERLLVKELIQGLVLGFLLGFLTAFLLLG